MPGRVYFGWDNNFKVFAPKKHFSLGNEEGATLHGFWKDDFDKAFYIYKIQEIIEGKCKETGKRCYSLCSATDEKPLQDFGEYREIAQGWIDEQLEKPFVAKAHDGLNIVNKTDCTLPMYIGEVCFYKDIDDIYRVYKLAEKQGSEPPWSNLMTWKRANRFVFDAEFRSKPNAQPLPSFIHNSVYRPETLVFVHFKDEQDILCHAQSAFINVMSFYLKEQHENMDIKIVDVVVHDEKGRKPYLKEWKEYFASNMLGKGGSCHRGELTPFVMVFGKPDKDAWSGQKAFVRRQGSRLVDFDLFLGYRSRGDNKETNALFRKNLKQAMHETWRAAGMVANYVTTLHRDYRGMPELDAETIIWGLRKNAVVIQVHTEEKAIIKMAKTLCNHLKSSGCPYVTLVITDGPKDIIEVYDDTDEYTEIYDIDGSEETFWRMERIIREVYAGHKLNGASPFLISSDSEKDYIKEDSYSNVSTHSDAEPSS